MIVLDEGRGYLKKKGGTGVKGWIRRRVSKEARHHDKGKKGEELVINALMSLDDTYYLVNDVILPATKGNIDHVIVSPNGVFAIETKNWQGEYVCEGDDWSEHRRKGLISEDYPRPSPSKQIKKNAYNLFQLIKERHFNNRFSIWVNSVVVFTDPQINLKLYDPTVPILRLEDLNDHILTTKSKNELYPNEIEPLAFFIYDINERHD
jgi:Nuclease-related domain